MSYGRICCTSLKWERALVQREEKLCHAFVRNVVNDRSGQIRIRKDPGYPDRKLGFFGVSDNWSNGFMRFLSQIQRTSIRETAMPGW